MAMPTPLHDLVAEETLTSILLNAPDLRPVLLATVKPQAFYDDLCRLLWTETAKLYGRGESVGFYEVTRRLELGVEEAGRVRGLRSAFVNVEAWEPWADRVNTFAEARMWRQGFHQWYRDMRRVTDGGLPDVATVRERIGKALAEAAAPSARQLAFDPGAWAERVGHHIADRRGRSFEEIAMPLGLGQIDGIVAAEPGDLIAIKGLSGRGKTSLAVHISATLGISLSRPGLYGNTEMGLEQIGIRFYAWVSEVDSYRIRLGTLTDLEYADVEQARATIAQSGLHLTDALKGQDIPAIIALARQHKAQYGIDWVVVDHLQRTGGMGTDKEYLEFQRSAQMLKELAQELGILVIMVTQMTEDGHFAGSKRLKWESDCVLEIQSLDRTKDEDQRWFEAGATGWIAIDKARNAPDGAKRAVTRDATTNRWRVHAPEPGIQSSGEKPSRRRRN